MAVKLLTIQETAGRLGLHPQTVRKIIKSGRLRVARIGHSIRIRPEDLEEFIEQSQADSSLFDHPARETAWERFRSLRTRLGQAKTLAPQSGTEILSGMRR
jgi:excisionase family DNA binding protein